MNSRKQQVLLSKVAAYYSSKLAKYGETPRGVDWNGEESQTLRFEQLCKVMNTLGHFSVNDLGCGYGALYDFLTHRYESIIYSGIDISEGMVHAAERRYHDKKEFSSFILVQLYNEIIKLGKNLYCN